MLGGNCHKCNGKMESIGVTTTSELVFQCSSCRTLFTIDSRGQWTEYPMETPEDMMKIKREVKLREPSPAKPHSQVCVM